jgi:hypothetical protein
MAFLPLQTPTGVGPQSVTSAIFPRDIPAGAWRSVEIPASASYTITPMGSGTHFAIEVQLRSSTAATSDNLAVKVNGDTTTGDYHWQRVGAANNAASVVEGTTFDAALIAAGTSVAGYYSSVFFFFPEYRNTVRQKVCYVTGSVELAALNQTIYLTCVKRQTAGVGALTDALSSFQLASVGNIDGTVRWAEVQR